MIVADAFSSFERAARAAGLLLEGEHHTKLFGNRLAQVARGSAELRLIWDGRDERLSLDISHGPLDGQNAGRLNLFSSTCPDAVVIDESNCLECIEYGIELMSPNKRDDGI